MKSYSFFRNLIKHDLRFVYIDLVIRMLLNFYIFTIVTVKVDSNIFSMYAFAMLISTLILQIVNGSTEIAVNKSLVNKMNYLNYFIYKLALMLILFIPFFLVYSDNFYLVSLFFITLINLIIEHFEIKLRFNYNYNIYRFKIVLQVVFFYFKYNSSNVGDISGLIFYSLIEVLILLFLSYYFSKEYLKNRNSNIIIFMHKEGEALIKYTMSSMFIFLFFKLDQIYIYIKADSHIFSSYFIASRFNEVLNSVVAIWARYSIPNLFLENNFSIFRKTLIVNIIIHFLFSIIFLVPVALYVFYLNPMYPSVIYIYMILSLSGFFLVFGQVRGVYFIKNNFISPDIINAIIGMFIFLLALWLLNGLFDGFYVIPIAYLFGFMFSGFLTTFIYKMGRDFMLQLFCLGGNRG